MRNQEFFQFIETNGGDIEAEILKVQGINNVSSLLRSTDVFSIFRLDCDETQDLRGRACFQLTDETYLVRPAIRENLDYCVSVLREKLSVQEQPKLNLLNDHIATTAASLENDSFLHSFLENINSNMVRSKHHYVYSTQVQRFASALFTLCGRNTFEFLRLNFPGALPSIPTLESYNGQQHRQIEEAEFRFQALEKHMKETNCTFAYGSEDCTGAVVKVHYDVASNSFIGFCPQLRNGVPSMRKFQFDEFHLLESYFKDGTKSNFMNIHVVQPISSITSVPFLLSAFGTDNTVKSISIIRRWLYIYDQCYANHVRIIGFSADAAARYIKAMRLASGE